MMTESDIEKARAAAKKERELNSSAAAARFVFLSSDFLRKDLWPVIGWATLLGDGWSVGTIAVDLAGSVRKRYAAADEQSKDQWVIEVLNVPAPEKAPVELPAYYKERFEKWVEDHANFQGAPRALAYQAFLAGIDAKADRIHAKQLEREIEEQAAKPLPVDGCSGVRGGIFGVNIHAADRMEVSEWCEKHLLPDTWQCREKVEAEALTLTPYEAAIRMFSDLESSEVWSYDRQVLELEPGVQMVALLYGVPTLRVADDVATHRREWVKQYLKNHAA